MEVSTALDLIKTGKFELKQQIKIFKMFKIEKGTPEEHEAKENVAKKIAEKIDWEKLSSEETQEVIAACSDEFFAIAIIKTGKLSPEQMIEILGTSEYVESVARSVVQTGRLSLEQMLEVFKKSNRGGYVGQEIIMTGKLTVEEMLEIYRLSEKSENVLSLRAIIKTGKLSPEQMIKILMESKNACDISRDMLAIGNFSDEQVFDIAKININRSNNVVMEIVKTGRFSVEQMLEILEATKHRGNLAVEIVNTGKLSTEQLIRVIELCGRQSHIFRGMIKTGKLSPEQLIKILMESDGSESVAEEILEVLR